MVRTGHLLQWGTRRMTRAWHVTERYRPALGVPGAGAVEVHCTALGVPGAVRPSPCWGWAAAAALVALTGVSHPCGVYCLGPPWRARAKSIQKFRILQAILLYVYIQYFHKRKNQKHL